MVAMANNSTLARFLGADDIVDYRIQIDPEFQGWAVMTATFFAMFLLCLPNYCAGSSMACCRRNAVLMKRHLPCFLVFMGTFDLVLIYLVVKWMPDWEWSDYTKIVGGVLKEVASHAMTYIVSLCYIFVAVFLFLVREQLFLLLNIKSTRIVKCRMRDIGHLCCGMKDPSRPIEICFWKAEDLKSAMPFTANNVFVEVRYGYNEIMKTRVHNDAGSACEIKETIQINFDETDDEENLHIFVKSQSMTGAKELGRLELKAEDIMRIEAESRQKGPLGPRTAYAAENFTEQKLHSRGSLHFRIDPIEEGHGAYSLTTC